MRERQLFIDGCWRPAQNDRRLAINDPATGEPVGLTALADTADIDGAVKAAERALPGWAAMHADAAPAFCTAPPISLSNVCQPSLSF